MAENGLVSFYNKHGYGVKSEEQFREARVDDRKVGEFLMDYYNPVEAFANKPSLVNGEQIVPRDMRPLPRS